MLISSGNVSSRLSPRTQRHARHRGPANGDISENDCHILETALLRPGSQNGWCEDDERLGRSLYLVEGFARTKNCFHSVPGVRASARSSKKPPPSPQPPPFAGAARRNKTPGHKTILQYAPLSHRQGALRHWSGSPMRQSPSRRVCSPRYRQDDTPTHARPWSQADTEGMYPDKECFRPVRPQSAAGATRRRDISPTAPRYTSNSPMSWAGDTYRGSSDASGSAKRRPQSADSRSRGFHTPHAVSSRPASSRGRRNSGNRAERTERGRDSPYTLAGNRTAAGRQTEARVTLVEEAPRQDPSPSVDRQAAAVEKNRKRSIRRCAYSL